MDGMLLEPWVPPPEPDLARLAMAAADAEGLAALSAWPELRKGGIGFGDLPPFLAWHGVAAGRHHLVLVQAREVGALVPGARPRPLPEGWLADLDLAALARPLRVHPAFQGGASVHVAQVLGPGRALLRSAGEPAAAVAAGVLARISAVPDWDVATMPAAPPPTPPG